MYPKTKAYIAAILFVSIIGLSFMFIKIALRSAAPLDILAGRFAVAFIAGTAVIFIRRKKILLKRRDIVAILPLAVFYPVLFFSCQVFGLFYTGSAQAGIIQACTPILTLLLAVTFLKESPTMGENIFTFLSVGGVIYIFVMGSSQQNSGNLLGIILIFFSALSASCYNVLAKNLIKKYSAFTLTYVMTFLGMLVFNCAALVRHAANDTIMNYFYPFFDKTFFFCMIYLGVLSSLITSFLSNYALEKIDASKMSVFTNLGTLITIAAGVLFLKETLYEYQIIGAVPILLGVIGTNYLASRHAEKD